MAEKINTSKAPAAIGPYSQGVRSGNFLFTSEQIPLSAETGEVVGTEITEQTKQVLQNLKAVLEAGGSSLKVISALYFGRRYSERRFHYQTYEADRIDSRSDVCIYQQSLYVFTETARNR